MLGSSPNNPISSRARYVHFGTPPSTRSRQLERTLLAKVKQSEQSFLMPERVVYDDLDG